MGMKVKGEKRWFSLWFIWWFSGKKTCFFGGSFDGFLGGLDYRIWVVCHVSLELLCAHDFLVDSCPCFQWS